MADRLKLKIILGSIREGRFSDKIAPWVRTHVEKHGGFEPEVLDLRDFEMPFFDQRQTPSSKTEPYSNEVVAKWTGKIHDGDVFLFVMPEYDRSVPGVLKNAIDWVGPEWNKKVAGFVGYGTVGGARAIEHARLMLVELQAASVRQAVNVFEHWTIQDETGAPKPGSLDKYERGMGTLLEQLAWWGRALKDARASQ